VMKSTAAFCGEDESKIQTIISNRSFVLHCGLFLSPIIIPFYSVTDKYHALFMGYFALIIITTSFAEQFSKTFQTNLPQQINYIQLHTF
ncbi:MAG: hypothetical protein ACI9UJ_002556, partial [bacterium]